MKNQEFKKLVFETADQWERGLYSRLKITEKEGLTLFSRPAFEKWLLQEAGGAQPLCLSIDPCGLTYLIDRQNCLLFQYDHKIPYKQHIPCIRGCGSASNEVNQPDRLFVDQQTLWILDRGNNRLLAYSTDLFQLKYMICSDEISLQDIGYDGAEYLYILDNLEKKIFLFDKNGSPAKEPIELRIKDSKELNDPFRIVVGRNGRIYVVDRTGEIYCLYMYIPEEERFEKINDFSDLSFCRHPFIPSIIIVSNAGSILVAERGSQNMYEYGPQGGYLGCMQIPGTNSAINCMAFDSQDTLYVGTENGIAVFTLSQNFVGETGEYYSQTLDKGLEKKPWHRLDMDAVLPENTSVGISYYSSDDLALKSMIDDIHASGKSVQQKIYDINNLLGPLWSDPERPARGMLFRGEKAAGRYLWLKLTLTTFNENNKPLLNSIKVYYPRLSYLRYLPATYQEDPISSDFLERFLSSFETVFYEFETEIESLFRFFDPMITPEGFLPWLASWLHLALEEEWSPKVKRGLIVKATAIYKKKGTLAGLADFLEVVLGQRPIIYEDAAFAKPFVLGGKYYVGDNIFVTKGPARGFRLGDDSILGMTAIRNVPGSPDDPFKASTHRFTVMLNLDREQYSSKKPMINRILNEEKPAHTEYTIRLIADSKVGHFNYVGVNTWLSGLKPFSIGISSIPGKTVLNIKGEKGGRLERNSRIGSTFTLM
jgi:phage tail-like protein